jgi:hypothetical protein
MAWESQMAHYLRAKTCEYVNAIGDHPGGLIGATWGAIGVRSQ